MTTRARRRDPNAGRNLGSRVARHIFGLFVLCTLLPLSIFALLALHNVTANLEEQAEKQLRDACKSTGMTIVERFGNILADLGVALEFQRDDVLASLRDGTTESHKRLRARVEWYAVSNRDSQTLAGKRPGIHLPKLSQKELQHLEQSHKLFAVGRDENARPIPYLVVDLKDKDSPRYLFCKIREDYIWGDDSIRPPNVEVLVLTEDGIPLHADQDLPETIQALSSSIARGSAKGRLERNEEGGSYLTSYRTMFMRPKLYRSFVIASCQSKGVVLAPVASFNRLFLLLAVLTLAGVVFASLVLIRKSMVPIQILTDATRSLRDKDFSTRVEIQTRDEFRSLGQAFNSMAASLEAHSDTMDSLHRIGIALTAERSSDRLIEMVAESSHSVTSASLAILHVLDKSGGWSRSSISFKNLDPAHKTMVLDADLCRDHLLASDHSSGAAIAAASGKTIQIDDLVHSKDFEAVCYKHLEELAGFTFVSLLCIPLRNHDEETIGVLELINSRDEVTGRIGPFSLSDRRVAESLGSQAAVALTKNRLIGEFQHMFESLAEVIATAIDEKSKYTGDHCRRMPTLSMMLANKVCAATSGPCADVQLTDDELYELKISALLHDCGKVTTPVHIIDKATKLEKIFDRIELVDCRFEVVKRELMIEHLQLCLSAGREDEVETLTQQLTSTLLKIDQERDFLRHTNVGREFMTSEDKQRVQEIAEKHRWTGPDGERHPLLTPDEIENLCIGKGTLTAEDREIINYHIVATIKMLEKLPFPKRLARVPEIAGAHHEKMDGTGYPVGLRRDQITVQGRILGLCDIFEALTAKDRPYKPGKKLSESLHILGKLKESNHIDPDLFQLFVESGVYFEYAQSYLDPGQIDEVDVSQIPGYSPPESMVEV